MNANMYKIYISILCLWCCLVIPNVFSQNYQSLFGYNNYTQMDTGNMNILISIPHDGSLLPASITTRTSDPEGGGFPSDTLSSIIGIAIRDELSRLFLVNKNVNVRPYLVINYLQRSKMDPNRNSTVCCYDFSEDSGKAYNDYHQNFIQNQFGNYMKNSPYRLGLLIDVHGQNHPQNWTELGYLLNPTNYNVDVLPDGLASQTSLGKLKAVSPQSFEELIRGSTYSFGALLEKKLGYKTVPSPNNRSPGNNAYFNGGQITKMYTTGSSFSAYRLAGFQMETAGFLRSGSKDQIKNVGQSIASVIYDYYFMHSFDVKNL